MKNICPKCTSKKIVKNGLTRHGDQNHKCKSCNRQFVLYPKSNKIKEETKRLIDKLIEEKLNKDSISRIANVSKSWINIYLKTKLN